MKCALYNVNWNIVPALLYVNRAFDETTLTAKSVWELAVISKISDEEIAKKFVKELKALKSTCK